MVRTIKKYIIVNNGLFRTGLICPSFVTIYTMLKLTSFKKHYLRFFETTRLFLLKKTCSYVHLN